jgi:uncharacterized membrane protein
MSLESRSDATSEPAGYRHIGLRAEWSERTITVVAVSMAVLIVALIAVLMGMA